MSKINFYKNKLGFTIIEILVVILIIGILAGISVPLYQKAVYKSRFAGLIPIARSIAKSNEVYFLVNKTYSTDPNALDVTVNRDSREPHVFLVNDSEFSYTMVNREDFPGNNYIIYQDHSANFPSQTHCEAAKDDKYANWLCEVVYKGDLLEGSITPNFNTYVLGSEAQGSISSLAESLSNISCSDSENSGNKSCEVTINNRTSVTKTYCTNKNNPSSCTYTTYQSDGSQNICYGSRAKMVNGECVALNKGKYEQGYDEDGNRTDYLCNDYVTNSGCYALGEEVYDQNGKHLAAANRYCAEWNAEGQCIAYTQGKGNDHLGVFEGNHKLWVRGDCQTIDTDGTCLSYNGGRVEEWEFDDDGGTISYKDSKCLAMNDSLQCTSYGNYKKTTYGTDSKTEDSYDVNNNSLTSKTYDAYNNQTYGVQYTCTGSGGDCSTYSKAAEHIFSYNDQHQETAHIRKTCTKYTSNGECSQYASETSSYKTYADDGVTVTSRITLKCKKYTNTDCTGGWTRTSTPYVNGVANDSQQVTTTCANANINTGECVNN